MEMRIGGVTFDYPEDVAYTHEFPSVYDGWAVAVLKTGERVNRWASEEDPAVPREGYERRHRLVEGMLGR